MAESPNYSSVSPNQVQLSFNDNCRSRDQAMSCSPSRSLHRQSSLMRMKTKSRLLDPPEKDRRSPRMVKSGVIGNSKASDIDDDPFLDEDLPQEFKKIEFSKWSVIQFCSLVLIVAAFISTLTITSLKRKSLYGLQLWRWELLVLVLISGRLVSGWVIRSVVYFVELNFLLRKRVLYFLYGLRNAVQNCIWLALVLIAWHFIFDDKVNRVTHGVFLPYVTKSWVCLLVATLIWLVKTLFVKVLASSFHVSTFFDRIQESLFNQYAIERLSGQPLIEIRQEKEEERLLVEVQKFENAGATVSPRTGKAIRSVSYSCIASSQPATSEKSPRYSTLVTTKNEDRGITIDHLHRFNQKNISAWNMKRLMNIVRHGALATLDEQILQDSTGEDETEVQISNEFQANTAAKKIFYNVAKPHSKYIYLEDLMRFMREDEARKMVCLFEGASESKGISKNDLNDWVVNAFTERRALALSLNDTKTAVNKLHQMLNVFVGIIVVVIWLLIFKVATTHFIVFLSSQLLLVVFVFGNTCKITFEAIIFLFVMHPFDVGDRCEVDGVQMVVEEMNILTTIFLRFDNQKISYPNSVLATKPISNYYRSPDMGDAIDFCVHISTPVEKIALMKKRINSFIENKSDHWHPAPMIVLRDMEDLNRLKISIWLSHKMNFQNMGERWLRRGVLVEEIIKVFREIDIEYRMLPLDVNVRNIAAVAASRVPSNWTSCA